MLYEVITPRTLNRGPAQASMPSKRAAPRVLATSLPQVLKCGTGVPVEPEVNTQVV